MVAMVCTAGGFILLSFVKSLPVLVGALTLIAVGYGLTVPCLSTLFSHVPVEQGIMQGLAGAIDRFGQAFGPVVGGSLLHLLGEAALMFWTGVALAGISFVCLAFIGDGCYSWLRELCCYPQAGYSKVSALEAIEEEADEEEYETDGEPSPAPQKLSSKAGQNGHHSPASVVAADGAPAPVHSPLTAQPATAVETLQPR